MAAMFLERAASELIHDLPWPSAQAKFRADIWMKGFLMSFVAMAPSLVLGLTNNYDNPSLSEDDDGWNQEIGITVALPAFLVFALTGMLSSRLPTVLGFGMLREKCPDICLKESARSSMTNNGIMLALFLTIFIAMLQAEKNMDGFTRNDIWYRVFCIFGMEACTRGMVMVAATLIFMEPLSSGSAAQFAVDNLLYLGEPTACMLQSVLYFLQAVILWAFNTDTKYVGILAYVILGYCIMRGAVVMQYLLLWQNPQLTAEVRKRRIKTLNKCKKVDGTGDVGAVVSVAA